MYLMYLKIEAGCWTDPALNPVSTACNFFRKAPAHYAVIIAA